MAPELAGPLNDLLIPFDPGRSLETVSDTLELYASAAPKVAAARSLVEDRLGSLPDADLEAVGAVFWAPTGANCARARDPAGCATGSGTGTGCWDDPGGPGLVPESERPGRLAAAVRELESSNARTPQS